ncbi:MAG: hypothetical protein IJF20_06765 [Clostridia bacterium]|nr:hypothetical protein [Clostridia bacterium]
MQLKDSSGTRYFYLETENAEKSMGVDIFGDSFDVILTPMFPDFKKDLEEMKPEKLKDKIAKKVISTTMNFAKDVFLFVECTYHVENFCDGDTINLDMTVYDCPSNNFDDYTLSWLFFDIWCPFPVLYMFYDALLNQKRLEPTSTICLDKKKTLKKARQMTLIGTGTGFFSTLIGYPINMARIRFLTREKRIFSTLLKFSRMDEEKRCKYIDEEDFLFENVK